QRIRRVGRVGGADQRVRLGAREERLEAATGPIERNPRRVTRLTPADVAVDLTRRVRLVADRHEVAGRRGGVHQTAVEQREQADVVAGRAGDLLVDAHGVVVAGAIPARAQVDRRRRRPALAVLRVRAEHAAFLVRRDVVVAGQQDLAIQVALAIRAVQATTRVVEGQRGDRVNVQVHRGRLAGRLPGVERRDRGVVVDGAGPGGVLEVAL